MLSRAWELARLWRTRSLDPEALSALQFRKLQRVVRRAYEEVPFYRALYREASFQPGDLRNLDDLRRLPVVTKQQLRQAGQENIVSRGFDWERRIVFHTSGTTGEPFQVLVSPRERRIRSLVGFRCLLAMGFRPRDRLVCVGPLQERGPSLHERLGLYRACTISGRLTPQEQLRRLAESKPDLLWCFPTALSALLTLAPQLRRVVQPRILIASSEVLEPALRRRAEEELRAEIFLSYVAHETGGIAAECPAHEGLHVNADHVLLEILCGDRPAAPGETGLTIVTTLNQQGMPLIRYQLGDLCAWTGRACSCGCTLPLIHPPEGRSDDMLRFAGGAVLSPLRLKHRLKSLHGTERYRVVQESEELIRVLIVPSETWAEGRTARLAEELTALLPPGVRLQVELVEQIEDTGHKFKTFVSKVTGEER
jgi:phenylacetate-CoA ligase